jgi:hypothetical protein
MLARRRRVTTPSFDPEYLGSAAHALFVIEQLRRGRAASRVELQNDHSLEVRTTITTRWNAEEGFVRESLSELLPATDSGTQPILERRVIAESTVERAIRRNRGRNEFASVLAEAIEADLAEARAKGDRSAARAHAARLIGPTSPSLPAVLDEIVRSVEVGDTDGARALVDELLPCFERAGVDVFYLGLRGEYDPTRDEDRAALVRTEGWLAALASLEPGRGELSYWRSAALELLGRRAEARVEYDRARKLGTIASYHSSVRPADLDPVAGRRALLALQRDRAARRAKR